MTWLRRWRGWVRLFVWGWCPACNSDAPEVDTCQVCRDALRLNYPPKRDHAREIWARFLEGK